jgi:hypothetical protein
LFTATETKTASKRAIALRKPPSALLDAVVQLREGHAPRPEPMLVANELSVALPCDERFQTGQNKGQYNVTTGLLLAGIVDARMTVEDFE